MVDANEILEHLQSPDPEICLLGLRRLSQFAKLLGPERTRQELIPYLQERNYGEPELEQTLVNQLTDWVPLVGGKRYSRELFGLLKQFAGSSDGEVRQTAVTALKKVGDMALDASQHSAVLDFCLSLADSEVPAQQIAAGFLMPLLTSRFVGKNPPMQELLMRSLKDLTTNDLISVRRATCKSIHELLSSPKTVENAETVTFVTERIASFAADPQEAVRLPVAPTLTALSRVPGLDSKQQKFCHETLRLLTKDNSWKVRYAALDEWPAFMKDSEMETWDDDWLPGIVNFLMDPEPEVAAAAVRMLPSIFEMFPDEDPSGRARLFGECQTSLMFLAEEGGIAVKTALAETLLPTAAYFPDDVLIDSLLPNILKLIRDSDHNIALTAMKSVEKVPSVIQSTVITTTFAPALKELFEQGNWRCRQDGLQLISEWGDLLNAEKLESSGLADLAIQSLGDEAFAARRKAVEVAATLVHKSKEPSGSIASSKGLQKHPRYLNRIAYIHFLEKLAQLLEDPEHNELMSALESLSQDPVPNVRITVARVLRRLPPTKRRATLLTILAEDSDPDVKHFSTAEDPYPEALLFGKGGENAWKPN